MIKWLSLLHSKLKILWNHFFILLSLYCFFVVNVVNGKSVTFPSRVEIIMDEDFDLPDGPGNGHRSIPPVTPFLAFFEWWPLHWLGVLSIYRWDWNCNFSEWGCCLLFYWEYWLSNIEKSTITERLSWWFFTWDKRFGWSLCIR